MGQIKTVNRIATYLGGDSPCTGWVRSNGGSNKPVDARRLANKILYKLLPTTEGGRALLLINTIDASVSTSCPPLGLSDVSARSEEAKGG